MLVGIAFYESGGGGGGWGGGGLGGLWGGCLEPKALPNTSNTYYKGKCVYL